MEEVMQEKKGGEIEEVKEEKTTRRIILPRLYICVNDDGTGYTGEIHLPGVERDSIELKMSEDYLTVTGDADDVEYRRTYWFGCSVNPETAKSRYKEGLLTFEVDFVQPKLSTIDIEIE